MGRKAMVRPPCVATSLNLRRTAVAGPPDRNGSRFSQTFTMPFGFDPMYTWGMWEVELG